MHAEAMAFLKTARAILPPAAAAPAAPPPAAAARASARLPASLRPREGKRGGGGYAAVGELADGSGDDGHGRERGLSLPIHPPKGRLWPSRAIHVLEEGVHGWAIANHGQLHPLHVETQRLNAPLGLFEPSEDVLIARAK